MDHPAHAEAVTHLRRVDPVIGQLIDRVGRVPPGPRTEGTHLGAIARAIVFQQLSGRAASTIHGRFEAIFGGRPPTAEELLAVPDEQLRAAGLSRAKAIYLKDLARHAAGGMLPVDRLHELDDVPLLEALTAVKGVGRWTAQMFLLFRLGRPDVLPDLDLGVRKAIQLAYGLRRLPTPKEVIVLGASWSPYASVAAWYLWRSLELPDAAQMLRRPSVKKRRGTRRATGRGRSAAGGARSTPKKKRAPPARTAKTAGSPRGSPARKTRRSPRPRGARGRR
jgi:DNA-3-methyladenine glycosylase II